jgi:hypothetical protein
MEAVVDRLASALENVGKDLPEHVNVIAIVRHDPPVPFAKGATQCAFVLCTEDFILSSEVKPRTVSSLDAVCSTAQLEIYKASEFNKKTMDNTAHRHGKHLSREDAKFLAGLLRRAGSSSNVGGVRYGSFYGSGDDYGRVQQLLKDLEG